jgi:nucleoid-associated protein YgaU
MPSPKPGQASLVIHWQSRGADEIPVQYNPAELQFEKQAQYAEINMPGLIAPIQQFVRGHAEVLTVELFFDTSDKGTGAKAESVTKQTDLVYSATLIEPSGHAPPTVTFNWGSSFPGLNLPDAQAGQRRGSFTGIITSCRQTFNFWSRGGIPLRAKLNLTIRQYLPLDLQLKQLNPSSPDRTHGHVLRQGEALHGVAYQYYRRADEWRRVALDNGIEDPRRLVPGARLRVPRIPATGDVA